jgi:hypothetical protein
MTGTPGQRQRRVAEVEGSSASPDGDYVTDVSGDRNTLVYAVIHMTMLDTCIDPGTPCEYYIPSGRVRRVVGRVPRPVPHVPPALALSAQGSRIALMVAAYNATHGRRPTGTIEVRKVGSGALVSSAVATGRPLDVALGPSILAVLTSHGAQRGIERFAVRNGRAVGATRVPSDAASLGISGRTIVYRSGLKIYVVDASSGKRRLAAVARSRPLGLTIEDNRILWAENSSRGNRLVWAPAGRT